MKTAYITFCMLLLFKVLPAQENDHIDAFLPAAEGMERFVLHLPEQEDESLFRIELIIGKSVQVDKDNKYFFKGAIEVKTVEGWGFSYYMLEQLGPMAGTLMALDPDAPKVDRFISLGGDPFFIRYNSKLPVVVYVPEGVVVKYRIWDTELKMETMNKG